MPEVIYLNGKFVAPEEAVVSVNDRGFLFGDAVYEALRSYDGRIWALERHLRRLQHSLEDIDLIAAEVGEIGNIIQQAHRRSELPNAFIYLQVTRGAAPRAHAYTRDLVPTVLVTVRDITPMLAEMNLEGESAITAPDVRWRRCDLKSTNLLPNILAHTRAVEQGAHEALLVDEQGCITETATTSVFGVKAGALFTTPLSTQILPSITREFVIEIAHDLGILVREERVPLERWREADEAFLTSTSHEVWPLVRLDGRPIADGRAGPITRRLQAGFCARVAAGDDAPR